MRLYNMFVKTLLTLLVVSSSTFASQLPDDGLSVTPQDGHILFNDSIDHAQSSIDMIMFRLTDLDVVQHLLNAQQRGVKIRIILDQQALGGTTTKAIFDQLNSAGLAVTASSSLFTITHAKAAVFDNQWALITSINMTRVYATSRDFGIRTYDPGVVAEFESVFETDLLNAQNQTKNTPQLTSPKLVWSPVNSKDRLIAFINSAQSSVVIEVENLGDNDVMNALKTKAQNGVKVLVLVPACVEGGGTRNIPLLNNLISAGVDGRVSVPPYTTENPYIHAKAIVVDQQNFYVGSENLSYNSLTQAREVGIIENSPQISSTILRAIGMDVKLSSTPSQLDASFACPEYNGPKPTPTPNSPVNPGNTGKQNPPVKQNPSFPGNSGKAGNAGNNNGNGNGNGKKQGFVNDGTQQLRKFKIAQ
ncbi:MAG: phospholipase D-like domain-containing protein [Pseudobdellovibrionaceae bacterium]